MSAARRREAEMSGERRCFRREDEAGGVSKPGGGGGAIRLYSGDTAFSFRYKKNIETEILPVPPFSFFLTNDV